MRMDRETDMTQLIGLSQFCERTRLRTCAEHSLVAAVTKASFFLQVSVFKNVPCIQHCQCCYYSNPWRLNVDWQLSVKRSSYCDNSTELPVKLFLGLSACLAGRVVYFDVILTNLCLQCSALFPVQWLLWCACSESRLSHDALYLYALLEVHCRIEPV